MNSTAHMRRLVAMRWPRLFIFLSAALLILKSNEAAAQSTQLVGERQAVAQGIADAVRQNDDAIIDREVFGGTRAGALTIGTFTTGRIRYSDHDGVAAHPLINFGGVPDDGIRKSFAFRTDEASLFVNAVVSAPDMVFGGQMKFAGFVGGNWLALEVVPNRANPGTAGAIGDARNETIIVGGTALWSRQSTYVVGTFIGNWGNSNLTDKVGDFPNVHTYKYGTHGYMGSLSAGQVFPMGADDGPKLDLRGILSYMYNANDPFQNVFDNTFKVRFSTWSATLGATVFRNMAWNGGTLRPFVQAYIRQEFGYDYKLLFIDGGGPYTLTSYDQRHTYPGVDLGVSYVVKNFTFGASVYGEMSADERTLGARFRASWQLN